MRQERTLQASIFDLFAGHEIGRELKAMSAWLDEQSAVIGRVAEDLRRQRLKPTGRHGLPAESVLRCALLKQHRQLSYEELAFHLEDSASFRAFARLPLSWTPKKSALQGAISAIRPETWEAINRALLGDARLRKVETGEVIRLDSTVTEALMHEPSDSSLLWDAVRIIARLLKAAEGLAGIKIAWRDRRRAAKRRAYAIQFTRGRPKRVRQYRELIAIARAMLASLEVASARLAPLADPRGLLWRAAHDHYRPLMSSVLQISLIVGFEISLIGTPVWPRFTRPDQNRQKCLRLGRRGNPPTTASWLPVHENIRRGYTRRVPYCAPNVRVDARSHQTRKNGCRAPVPH